MPRPVYMDIELLLEANRRRNPRPLSIGEIIRVLTRGEDRVNVRQMAQRYAAKLAVTEEEFILQAGRR